MHAYRSHTCAELNTAHVGQTVRLSGWVHRVRDHGGVLFIDLRDHYGITQVLADSDSPAFAGIEKVRAEWVHPDRRAGEGARCGAGQPEDPDRRDRGLSSPAWRCWAAADELPLPVFGEVGLPRGDPADATASSTCGGRELHAQHDAALERGRGPAQADVGAGLQRVPDADHHRLLARRRARLPGAVAAASGQVLRAAAGAAAVQAADHGGGVRPLLPDRALFPRRRPARRPLARRTSTSSTSR